MIVQPLVRQLFERVLVLIFRARLAQLSCLFTLGVTVSNTRCGSVAKCCNTREKSNGGASHRSNAEGASDWGLSRVIKDTKLYQGVSGDFERQIAAVGSVLVGYAFIASFLTFI